MGDVRNDVMDCSGRAPYEKFVLFNWFLIFLLTITLCGLLSYWLLGVNGAVVSIWFLTSTSWSYSIRSRYLKCNLGTFSIYLISLSSCISFSTCPPNCLLSTSLTLSSSSISCFSLPYYSSILSLSIYWAYTICLWASSKRSLASLVAFTSCNSFDSNTLTRSLTVDSSVLYFMFISFKMVIWLSKTRFFSSNSMMHDL